MDETKRIVRRHKSRGRPSNFFQVRRHFWNLQSASRQRTALIGFIIGLVLGGLVGATMTLLPNANNGPSATMDANEATQMHLKGKPDIK